MLDRKSFDVIMAVHEMSGGRGAALTQRDICEETGFSLGTVNACVKGLRADGILSDANIITDRGYAVLEDYRVRRAVFIAAGFGSRMVPVTLSTPKPLVVVNGRRIIDTVLDALVAQDIRDVHIVRGYLSEQFDALLQKYPFVKFIENDSYSEANNISSALLASHLLERAYICEADLLLSNPKIITKYQYQSNILGMMKERTDDWCFNIRNGYITEEVVGGVNQYQEVGITYLDEKDGRSAGEDLKKAYAMPGGKELFWEQIFFKVFKGKYKIAVRECKESDIVEIDTFSELKSIDKSYDV